MQVGDLVKFKNNGMIGLVVKLVRFEPRDGEHMFTISWADGHSGPRFADELELISASG